MLAGGTAESPNGFLVNARGRFGKPPISTVPLTCPGLDDRFLALRPASSGPHVPSGWVSLMKEASTTRSGLRCCCLATVCLFVLRLFEFPFLTPFLVQDKKVKIKQETTPFDFRPHFIQNEGWLQQRSLDVDRFAGGIH